jgi:hypothetical protein
MSDKSSENIAKYVESKTGKCQDDSNLVREASQTGTVLILGVPAHGEYSGETEFLGTEGVLSEASLKARTRIIREPVDRILLATDGVSDDYFPNDNCFTKLSADIDALEPVEYTKYGDDISCQPLVKWLDTYYVRGSFDDRTLVILDINSSK